MHKQRVMRTPLIAVLGLVAFLIVPSVAQAHYVKSEATCELVGTQPTVELTVRFLEFEDEAQPTIRGSVGLDGVAGSQESWTNGPPALTWSSRGDATLVKTWPVAGGKTYTVDVNLWWFLGGKKYTYDESHVTAKCPEAPTPPANPAIDLVKTGVSTANAGDTVTYEFAATNTGNVKLDDVQLTDDRCQATLARKAGETDTTFDPGDVWNYTCTAVVPSGVTSVTNVAEVCGTYKPPAVDMQPKEVCDTDDHTFPVPPTTTTTTTTPTTPTTPGTPGTPTTPGGGVLPETVASGLARLRGPSGCVDKSYTAKVIGRSIRSVAFYLDGKLIKRINKQQRTYKAKIFPKRYGFGRHKVVARVQFLSASGTPAKRLQLTFRRCAQGAVAPRFTG